jgi:hypothetical protein
VTEKEDPRGRSALDDLKIVDPGALQGDPFARKSGALSTLRASGRGWVAAVIAVGVLVLAWRFSAPVSQQVAGTPGNGTSSATPGATAPTTNSATPVTTTGGSTTPGTVRVAPSLAPAGSEGAASGKAAVAAPVRLQSADPTALKARIVEEFQAAGVEAIGYDRLDLSGVDVKLPDPVPPPVQAVLNRHGIPLPSDGIVRVEIAQSR